MVKPRNQTPLPNSAAQRRCPTPLQVPPPAPSAIRRGEPAELASSTFETGDRPKPATCHADQLGAATVTDQGVELLGLAHALPPRAVPIEAARQAHPGNDGFSSLALIPALLRQFRGPDRFREQRGSRLRQWPARWGSKRTAVPPPSEGPSSFCDTKALAGITARTPTRMASLRQDPIGELPFCWRSPRSRSSFPSCSCPHLARAGAAGSTNRRLQ